MGILSSAYGIAKARATQGMLRKVLGGPLSTALIAAYLGRKAYLMYRQRQRRIS